MKYQKSLELPYTIDDRIAQAVACGYSPIRGYSMLMVQLYDGIVPEIKAPIRWPKHSRHKKEARIYPLKGIPPRRPIPQEEAEDVSQAAWETIRLLPSWQEECKKENGTVSKRCIVCGEWASGKTALRLGYLLPGSEWTNSVSTAGWLCPNCEKALPSEPTNVPPGGCTIDGESVSRNKACICDACGQVRRKQGCFRLFRMACSRNKSFRNLANYCPDCAPDWLHPLQNKEVAP